MTINALQNMNSSVIRRVRHLAAFFILPLLFSCSEGSPDFRMMSFNVRYINDAIDTGQTNWESRKGPVLKLLKDKMPDVIGFQEPRREQVDFIVAGLPMYGHIELGRDYGISEDGGEHLMIMYIKDKYDLTDSGSFWMSPTPDVVSRGWDAMCRRITVWVRLREKDTGKELYFFDTHFDHIGVEARRQEALLLAEKMKEIAGESAPVFVCGDFNMDSSDPSMAPIRDWMNEACADAPLTDKGYTYNGFGIGSSLLKIDHVFYRNALPLTYSIIREDYGVKYVSDHYPVLAEFDF